MVGGGDFWSTLYRLCWPECGQRTVTDRIRERAIAAYHRRCLIVVDQTTFPPTHLLGVLCRDAQPCRQGGEGGQGRRDPQILLPSRLVRVELANFTWSGRDVYLNAR